MKKLVLAVGTLVALASCAFNPFVSSSQPTALVLNDDFAIKTTAAASLLTDALSGNTGGTLSARKDRRLTESEELEAIDKVHQYLGIMNQILTDHPIETELVESDRDGFEFKSIVTTTGLDGLTSEFVIYFNGVVEDNPTSSEDASSEETSTEVTSESSETSSSEESTSQLQEPSTRNMLSVENDDEINEDYDDEVITNDDINEADRNEYHEYRNRNLGELTNDGELTSLRGIAVVGELEYQMVGFTKTDGDQVISKYFLWLDQSNWIRISTDNHIDQLRYRILMRVNGEVSKMMFAIEQNDSRTQVKLFIKFENRAPEMYHFRSEIHEETGGQLIRIHARVAQEIFKAVVLIYTDENGDVMYNYRFIGSTRDYDRNGGRDYHNREQGR